MALGKHLEAEYCEFIKFAGLISSCDDAEELPDAMDVEVTDTSTDHDYYKTTTVNEDTGSSTYYGHSECFKE